MLNVKSFTFMEPFLFSFIYNDLDPYPISNIDSFTVIALIKVPLRSFPFFIFVFAS